MVEKKLDTIFSSFSIKPGTLFTIIKSYDFSFTFLFANSTGNGIKTVILAFAVSRHLPRLYYAEFLKGSYGITVNV